MSRSTRTLALASMLAAGAQAAAAGTITGTVTYEGKVPVLKPLDVAAEPVCAKKHPTVPNEVLVLGPGNTMANIMVRVVGGLPAGKTYPPPAQPLVMDQQGCQYVPHVMGIMVGQQFNLAMPPARKEATATFGKEEGMFVIKCDVHPWMRSYIGVFSNPFFAVTKADGKFEIANLPAGTYQVEAWHERLGTQKATVTVGATETKPVAFKFAAPAAK